jgi:tricorn protease
VKLQYRQKHTGGWFMNAMAKRSALKRSALFGAFSFSIFFILALQSLAFPLAKHPQELGSQDETNLLALPPEKPILGMSTPALSPDGKEICFVYRGSLWLVSSKGGKATRLTIRNTTDFDPHWSPDGQFIAFSSLRRGNFGIYIIPARGGEPRQVTYFSGSNWVTDWMPDGYHLLFYSAGRDTHTFAIFSIDLRDRSLKQLTHDTEPLRFAVSSPDGKQIAYTRSGQPWWRGWYRGSVAAQTMVEDLATGRVRQVLSTPAQQFWPLYAPDGRSLFITTIYGRSNTPNIWRVPLDGGPPQAVTHYTTDAVRWPSIARNGSLICYLYKGDIYTVKPDGSDAHPLTIYAPSDSPVQNTEQMVLHDGADESHLSPDGKTLALVLKGNIWLVPTTGGDAERLTNNIANNNDLTWSPDGTRIGFISDVGNQPDLYTIDVKTKQITRLTNDMAQESNTNWSPDGVYIAYAKAGPKPGLYVVRAAGGELERMVAAGNGDNLYGTGINSFAWSPDSKWLAFSRMDRYGTRDIWVVPSVGGTPVNITAYPNNNADPQFTRDGKYLIFISDRNGTPQLFRLPLLKPGLEPKQPPNAPVQVKIDFDGITDRAELIQTPAPVDDYAITPDSKYIVFHANNNFWAVPVQGGSVTQLTSQGEPGGGIEFTPDGKRFFYLGANGTPRSLGAPPGPAGTPEVVNFNANYTFNRELLYLQAFNEFYRRFGAAFYDPSMNGVNWAALWEKYKPQLDGVGTPWEFANLLSEMVGEVNSSHSEISPAIASSGPQTATLGLKYDYNYLGPGLKVVSVMPDGPGDQPQSRINPGDYILQVDGKPVSMNEYYYQTLQDKAGKTVKLLVNTKPTEQGARTVEIKPITLGQWADLEYKNWVKQNRELVDKLSGGRLAYIHIRAMDQSSLRSFERDLYSIAMRKEGLILDIRRNGGGNTHNEVLRALDQKVYAYTKPRDGLLETQPLRAFTKPIVLLIDQNSYSDAEIFAASFEALKRGLVVGVPTPGYVIGTYEGTLVDGTHFRLPSWGYYTLSGQNLENLGVKPDIIVVNKPNDIAEHKDNQLIVAVQTLLRELPPVSNSAENPPVVLRSANDNPNGGSSADFHGIHGTYKPSNQSKLPINP